VSTYNDPPSSRASGEMRELTGDWICVHGPLLQTRITRGEVQFHDGSSAPTWMDLRNSSDAPVGEETSHVHDEWLSNFNMEEVWCLLLGESGKKDKDTTGEGHGLILVPTDATIERAFVRIGIFLTINDSGRDVFHSSGKSTVVIF
jgi:hypothetical protein